MEVPDIPLEVVDVELEFVCDAMRCEEEVSHLLGFEDGELVQVR